MKTRDDKRGNLVAALGFVAVLVAALGGWLWWSSRQFEHSGDHWIARASDAADAWANDAEWVAIEGRNVKPNGVAALSEPGAVGWRFEFRSPSLQATRLRPRDDSAIPGAPPTKVTAPSGCFEWVVSRGAGRASNLVNTFGSPQRCRSSPAGASRGSREAPRRSIAQVWAMAKAQGAPDPGFATIRASLNETGWHWSFVVEGYVELSLDDAC
jgi:hypothetical protein